MSNKKNKHTFATRFEKMKILSGETEFIDKTKTNSKSIRKGDIPCQYFEQFGQDKLREIKTLYNEEFDPGSG